MLFQIASPAKSRQVASRRIQLLDAYRAIACLSVCACHIATSSPTHPFSGFFAWLGKNGGGFGVTLFFVISGFVIPYSMFNNQYQVRNYGRFLLRRIARLDPPYLAAIIVALALAALKARSRNIPFQIDIPTVLLHFGYLNAFFGKPYIISVFWSLAIEFQYYLLIGLLFPLLVSRHIAIRFLTPLGFALLSSVLAKTHMGPPMIWSYAPYFVLGLLAFSRYTNQMSVGHLLAGFFLVLIFFCPPGRVPFLILSLSSVVLVLLPGPQRWVKATGLEFIGGISYSLYLTHELVLGRLISIAEAKHFLSGSFGQCAVFLLELVLCVTVAYVFYFIFEAPAMRLSSSIRYRARESGQGSQAFSAKLVTQSVP